MELYDRVKVEKETVQARQMFVREIPKMFGYVAFFYVLLGAGIPWRMETSRDVIWDAAQISLLFGLSTGAIALAVGGVLMSMYLLRKAPYTAFSPGASLTLVWSFRLFGFIGVPLAVFDVFRIILPATGNIGVKFFQDWWMWLLLVSCIAGWFAGRSVGGLIGLLAIWVSGRKILKINLTQRDIDEQRKV